MLNIIKRVIFLWAILMAILYALSSCSTDANEFTVEERYAADTLFQNIVNAYRIELDSICQQKSDSLFWSAVDSLKDIRMKEIEYLLEKN